MIWKKVAMLETTPIRRFRKSRRLLKLLRVFAIVTILVSMILFLTSCTTAETRSKLEKNNCLEYVITWEDVLNCAIMLDAEQ